MRTAWGENRKGCIDRGAYLLYFELSRSITLEAGALGRVRFPSGRYIYVGSARSGITLNRRAFSEISCVTKRSVSGLPS